MKDVGSAIGPAPLPPLRQLPAAVDGIVGVVDIENDARRNGLEAGAKHLGQGQPDQGGDRDLPHQFRPVLAPNRSSCYCRGRSGAAIWGISGITRTLSDHGMANTGADPQTGANHAIVLFDGVCNLCDASVRFIIARDRHDRIRFAALQSATGRSIAAEFGISGNLSTFFLIEDGRAYERSDAWLRILRNLGGPWSALNVFIIVPRPIRDWFYGFVGRNRYRWFGKTDYCPTPDPGLQHKFLA